MYYYAVLCPTSRQRMSATMHNDVIPAAFLKKFNALLYYSSTKFCSAMYCQHSRRTNLATVS